MMGSMTPLAKASACHPVHRATALLREALYSSASTAPDPAEIWSDPIFRLDPTPVDLGAGPVSLTYPASLAAPLGLPSADEDRADCQSPVMHRPDGGAADASLEEASQGDEMLDQAAQLQLEGLAQAFYRRQRQASLLVACSVATAFVLTLGGLVLLFSIGAPAPSDKKAAAPKDGTSLTRAARSAELAPSSLPPMQVVANHVAKAAPLPALAKTDGTSSRGAVPGTQSLYTQPERPLALGPLLPLGSARYVLLRGLPEHAELSAGRRTGGGSWMVKGEDVDGLTLTLGHDASGDYPLEAYLLGAEDGPQARRRLVLHVDAGPKIYGAGFGLDWPTALFAAAPQAAESAAAPVAVPAGPQETDALHGKAHQLLAGGDVAAARLLLMDLAKGGLVAAAYELALTYDPEVLAKAGLAGIGGDMKLAETWYANAARAGHADAAARLEIIARSRAGA